MDEKNHPGYSFKAPGSSGSPLRLPGRGPFPGVDDHLVVPEVTRDEIIGGRRVVAHPAQPPHATQQSMLDYVLQAHVASGYTAAADLLTRHDVDSDFASDSCVFKEGVDPETGGRYLEEIAFEVVSEQNERNVREKAPRMHRRGVRRIFAVFVKGQQRVCEWSPESQSWCLLDPDSRIEDPCLVAPLSVAALLDASAADNAVVEALAAKSNPAILQREAKAEAKGVAEAILKVLEARGVEVSSEQRQEISSCRIPDRLDRWLRRAALASSASEVTSEL
ncbi:MAG TPA: hypothetical protein VKK31_03020 [Thermoanaerobaculia bacterium]|nr:hypothetical protein [Thermoanaerobaculia bacterium]